ncbi:MAG: PEP-CTERM sorting domain-containing protein [Candidatus Omnitrophica bacterium]|nr:PEP-CTERM sorting domain-containing protein [Candidatus Omnitrophota bacterium]MDD5672002.1 PEP-CTERM sorting domain-containing protein [Candidatus Omnitrophota bacterium]
MMRIKVGLLALILGILLPVGFAQAAVFINFDNSPVTFSPDAAQTTHTLTTADGTIDFFGMIKQGLNNINPFSPLSPGSGGNFLKAQDGTGSTRKITFNFSYDVDQFYGSAIVLSGYTGVFRAYGDNAHNILLGEQTLGYTGGSWYIISLDFTDPIRYIEFYTVNSSNTIVGNKAALDDITICPQCTTQVPEPASMLLLGFGLLGAGFLRIRKK